jgi:hypothetical protein
MWQRLSDQEGRPPLVMYRKNGITEVYDKNALERNITCLEKRLVDERKTLDVLAGCLIEVSIEHLKEGLTLI